MRVLLLLILLFTPLLAQAEVSITAQSPLTAAVTKGDVEGVKVAIMNKGNVNSTLSRGGQTLLINAVTTGKTAIARLLIEARANVNLADELGNTPLFYAASGGDVELVDLLLKASARVDAANRQGLTPLMAAARAGQRENVAHLLSAGAKATASDFSGRTALDWAEESRQRSVIALLQKQGR